MYFRNLFQPGQSQNQVLLGNSWLLSLDMAVSDTYCQGLASSITKAWHQVHPFQDVHLLIASAIVPLVG
jgi:hypothetical protein